ncbi:hypothetical protein F5Y03DRAFT_214171 [Xylaria venustula]|nr:hypothetical protein F5Y03DRAFT_214171 [Xylaria venustula]
MYRYIYKYTYKHIARVFTNGFNGLRCFPVSLAYFFQYLPGFLSSNRSVRTYSAHNKQEEIYPFHVVNKQARSRLSSSARSQDKPRAGRGLFSCPVFPTIFQMSYPRTIDKYIRTYADTRIPDSLKGYIYHKIASRIPDRLKKSSFLSKVSFFPFPSHSHPILHLVSYSQVYPLYVVTRYY